MKVCKNECCVNWEESCNGNCDTYAYMPNCPKSWIESKIPKKPTDWSKVKKFAPVWVRDMEGGKWLKANFIRHEDGYFYATRYSEWVYKDGDDSPWRYCKLAEEEYESRRS